MEGRQRSPSYPSTPLAEAIDLVRKIHNEERTNTVDRAVAAKAMGYSGISGRSATVLSNLNQFGLVEKAGKSELRVTRRAVEILYPDTEHSKADALRDAAREPELFRAISERFTDGLPSETALQAYLIRQGYTHAAVPSATRAFLETFLFLENAIGSGSNLHARDQVIESQQNQHVEKSSTMSAPPSHKDFSSAATSKPSVVERFDVRIADDMLWLGGTVRNQAEADQLIAYINALKPMLRPAPPPSAVPSEPSASLETSKTDETNVFD